MSLKLLLDNPEARIDPNALRGHLETSLLEHLVSLDQLEPRGDNCTKVCTLFSLSLSFSHLPSLPLSLLCCQNLFRIRKCKNHAAAVYRSLISRNISKIGFSGVD